MVNANGAEVFNQCYIGKIDEAGIFDTVLTSDQVKHYMNNGYNPDGAPATADGAVTAMAVTAVMAGAALVIGKKKRLF